MSLLETYKKNRGEIVEDACDDIVHDAESFVADYSNKDWFKARIKSTIKDALSHHDQSLKNILEALEGEIRQNFRYTSNGLMNMDYNDKEAVGFNSALSRVLSIIREFKKEIK